MSNKAVLIGMLALAALSLLIPLTDDRLSPREQCLATPGRIWHDVPHMRCDYSRAETADKPITTPPTRLI